MNEDAEQELDRILLAGPERRKQDATIVSSLGALASLQRSSNKTLDVLHFKVSALVDKVERVERRQADGPSLAEESGRIGEHQRMWDWYNQVQGGLSLVKFLAGSGFVLALISDAIAVFAILQTRH
ncbi:MAG: hypothetical protein ACYDAY_11970 [Candidatus Dormibacteria bacterium]